MRKIKFLAEVMPLLFLLSIMTGCAGATRAIQHSDVSTKVKMSDTIFLDAAILELNRNIYVRITNTSEMADLNLDESIKSALRAKGFNIVKSPDNANHILQANLLYMDFVRDQSMTAEGMTLGGFGGALGGSTLGGSPRGQVAGGLAGAVVGGLLGAAIGKLYSVDSFIGVMDVQIQERVLGGVQGKAKTEMSQGVGNVIETARDFTSDYQTYRTRIAVEVTQTNIEKKEAAKLIEERLIRQIAGIF